MYLVFRFGSGQTYSEPVKEQRRTQNSHENEFLPEQGIHQIGTSAHHKDGQPPQAHADEEQEERFPSNMMLTPYY